MYSGTKFVILNFCTFNTLCLVDEGSKNLQEIIKFVVRYLFETLHNALKR